MSSRLDTIKNLLVQDPTSSRVRYMLCMEFVNEGRFAEAVTEFEELIRRDPDYAYAYFQAGKVCEGMNQPDRARKFYEDGIEAGRRSGDAHAVSELEGALDLLD
jgi:tetratricopeptide (TPR) repeat protein